MRAYSVLPGFGLSLGLTLLYLTAIVLLPLAMVVLRTAGLTPEQFWAVVTSSRALAAYRLSFGAALASSLVNVGWGLLVAWVLVRYEFPGRRLLDALVDLPFALPTAVAGITLTALYAPEGWVGRLLALAGVQAVFTPLGVGLALTFIGLPFVVRTVQPVLAALEPELEEAAATLGADRWQTFRRVLWPALVPALFTGFALACARTLGEYGSVVFIAGNLPLQTEIVPLLIVVRLEQYDYAGAAALASVMLAGSLLCLVVVQGIQRWAGARDAT